MRLSVESQSVEAIPRKSSLTRITASHRAIAMGMVFVASVPFLGVFSAAFLPALFTVPEMGTLITTSTESGGYLFDRDRSCPIHPEDRDPQL